MEMSVEQKVGILFIAPLCPLREDGHLEAVERLLTRCHVGALLLKRGTVESVERALDRLERAGFSVAIAADAEWGLGMRIEDAPSYPRNSILGEAGDLARIEEIGAEIGAEAVRLGIGINFSPVVDVNSNPLNPVIGTRSFGSDPEWVAECGAAMIRGLQRHMIACAKHFPGHGDTLLDSHLALPRVSAPRERLEAIEWPPFRRAIAEGVGAIMTAHVVFDALDPERPATLSPLVLGLLREEWGFEGLIITDALNMGALNAFGSPGEVALAAFLAGADLLLYGAHQIEEVDALIDRIIPAAYDALLQAVAQGTISSERLDQSVRRILSAPIF
jgi:beta-N-acetylhexosaminidase